MLQSRQPNLRKHITVQNISIIKLLYTVNRHWTQHRHSRVFSSYTHTSFTSPFLFKNVPCLSSEAAPIMTECNFIHCKSNSTMHHFLLYQKRLCPLTLLSRAKEVVQLKNGSTIQRCPFKGSRECYSLKYSLWNW